MMKALRVSMVVVALWLMASCAFAISLADCYVASGLKQANTHQHITTNANGGAVIGAFVVTATANGGYACLVQTASTEYVDGTGMTGQHYYTSSSSKVLADIREATANNTAVVEWPNGGLACGGKLFLDCVNATAEVYYKE